MRAIAAIVLLSASFISVAAEMSSSLSPKDYCSIGAEVGLPTRPYNTGTGTCASNYLDIGTASAKTGMPTNLAFYSMSEMGNPSNLQRVSLILNVNNPAETKAAREVLVKAAVGASKRILGAERAGLAAAIRAGKTTAWTGENWRTEVVYRNWENGNGHDISVRFIPTGGNVRQQ